MTGRTVHRPGARPVDRALELLLVGLARDEDEVLGDLLEGQARVASEHGERSARHWWRSQAVKAAPLLAWHSLTHTPATILLGIAGFVGWLGLPSLTSIGPFPGAETDSLPSVDQVIRDTVIVGLLNLLATFVIGAVLALVVRRSRLVPGLVAAALMALVSRSHGFYLVYGPGTCTTGSDGSAECGIELGPWSSDLIVPAAWQPPTMAVLVPVMVILGGLAVTAWHRQRRSVAPGG
jgi:hypothetical protein